MSFHVVGFDKHPLYRFSLLINAVDEFGAGSLRTDTAANPFIDTERLVCARVGDIGVTFKPEEVYRLARTALRAPSMPRFARNIARTLAGAADDAKFEAETATRRMI